MCVITTCVCSTLLTLALQYVTDQCMMSKYVSLIAGQHAAITIN